MTSNQIGSIALALAALGVLLLALVAIRRARAEMRGQQALASALERRAAALERSAARAADGEGVSLSANVNAPSAVRSRIARMFERLSSMGMRWLDTNFGRYAVAEEDRRLLEQCGYVDARSRGLFLAVRIVSACVAPLIFIVFIGPHLTGGRLLSGTLVSIAAGFMVPKVYVIRRAAARRQSVTDELPLLVDMLRLLQGVGLSLDQSIQVVTNDFKTMLPVLSSEVGIAQQQFAAGRTREQSLQRLSSSFDNEDLRAIVRLMIQVDKHGGAVQEPLKQFGDRLRETRRSMLRERIGRLTVKMTGVMIVTLLPALLIVTGGPGIIAVMRALAQVPQ